MGMDLMYKFVEIILVAATKVNEGLNSLVWVGGNVLALSSRKNRKHIIKEGGKIGDRVVDIGRFVNPDEGLIEDRKEVAKEVKGNGFFDDARHHSLVPLSSVHFQDLF